MLSKMLTNKPSLLALALTFVVMLPNVSQAEYLRGQPIYVQNNTDRPIWVAAKYMTPGANDFITNGFWEVPAGQTVHVLYNSNRWIYFYARDDNGKVWESIGDGITSTGVVNGESLEMGQYDTGMCFDPWTIAFGS